LLAAAAGPGPFSTQTRHGFAQQLQHLLQRGGLSGSRAKRDETLARAGQIRCGGRLRLH